MSFVRMMVLMLVMVASSTRAELFVLPPPLRELIPLSTALSRWSLSDTDIVELKSSPLLRKARFVERRAEIEEAAERDPVAALLLGFSMLPQDADLKLEPNYMEAFHWIHVAAQANMPRAADALALMYEAGIGTHKDQKRANELLAVAANGGIVSAMFNLGNVHAFGRGVEVNQREALIWYRKAAAMGHARAAYNIGHAHYAGDGVEKDLVEAVRWYQIAADGGAPHAMYNLAIMYKKGEGVAKDEVQSQKWLKLAAENGQPDAVRIINGQQ